MRRPALRFTAVAAVAAATALTACGSSNGNIPKNADPRTEFVTALENLGHSDALTSTLRFHATADQLVAFDKAVETSASDVMTPDAAAKLASGSVSFAVKTTDGKDISDRSKNRKANVRATLVDGGKTYVDFRVVDAALYLQV